MAIVYYVTNYATKLEDLVWKRAAAAAEALDASTESGPGSGPENRTRRFFAKVANRVFTERTLSQVEVAAFLMGFRTEFTHNKVWTYLNVSSLYWEVFRRWRHLRHSSSGDDAHSVDEAVMLEPSGQKITFVQAYPHRGPQLAALSLYDYMSVVMIKKKHAGDRARRALDFEESWPLSEAWVQVLRKPHERAVICVDGYLSMDFSEEDERFHRRYVQGRPDEVTNSNGHQVVDELIAGLQCSISRYLCPGKASCPRRPVMSTTFGRGKNDLWPEDLQQ